MPFVGGLCKGRIWDVEDHEMGGSGVRELAGVYCSVVQSSRFFPYLTLALIILAVVCWPATVKFVVQPEVMEYEEWHLGPVFTFLIGFLALASGMLGVMESSLSHRTVRMFLAVMLCVANLVSVSVLILQAFLFGGLSLSGWMVTSLLLLLPTTLMDVTGVLWVKRRPQLLGALHHSGIRLGLSALLLIVPFFFVVVLYVNMILHF